MTKDNCTLLIRDFPADLAEKVLSASGEKVLTRAVLNLLRDYFVLKKQFSVMKLKRDDLQSDLDLLLGYWDLEKKLRERKEKVLSVLSDPNRFYLHGD